MENFKTRGQTVYIQIGGTRGAALSASTLLANFAIFIFHTLGVIVQCQNNTVIVQIFAAY